MKDGMDPYGGNTAQETGEGEGRMERRSTAQASRILAIMLRQSDGKRLSEPIIECD